jgi:hypothetical protein
MQAAAAEEEDDGEESEERGQQLNFEGFDCSCMDDCNFNKLKNIENCQAMMKMLQDFAQKCTASSGFASRVEDVFFFTQYKGEERKACSLETQVNVFYELIRDLAVFLIRRVEEVKAEVYRADVAEISDVHNPLRYGNCRGVDRYDTDENPVIVRIKIIPLGLSITLSYLQNTHVFMALCERMEEGKR